MVKRRNTGRIAGQLEIKVNGHGRLLNLPSLSIGYLQLLVKGLAGETQSGMTGATQAYYVKRPAIQPNAKERTINPASVV